MPDISRSDSNRSDASRPRVSFNRDVHVKRISSPRSSNAYSLSPDGTTFVPTSVRRERPMTKTEMTKEAENVLKQVDKVSCKATTSNVKLTDSERAKSKKKTKESFPFLKRSDKTDRGGRNSSSDGDSGSSQEYRIYRVNSPNGGNRIETSGERNKRKRTNKKTYDFMSLDRKKLKKEKKNKNLEYLSLERNGDILEKIKKQDKGTNRTILFMFDKMESKSKNTTRSEGKDGKGSKPKSNPDAGEDKSGKKKQLSPIIEIPRMDYFEKKKEGNVDKVVKILSEKSISKLNKNTGLVVAKEPEDICCHNDNQPFCYGLPENEDDGLGGDDVDKGDGGKRVSPTSDVIYAQVIVGARDGNKSSRAETVSERTARNEAVERVFVGDEPSNRSKDTISSWKVETKPNATAGDMFGNVNTGTEESARMKRTEITVGPRESSTEYKRVIKVSQKYDDKVIDKMPTDLTDLSIRREILLSRSESQAKERFNSLKKLQEPEKVRRNEHGLRSVDKFVRNDVRYLGDDIRVNEKVNQARRIPRDVELVDLGSRKKRDVIEDKYKNSEERNKNGNKEERQRNSEKEDKHKNSDKEEKYKNSDKVHVIKTDDDDNLLRKLSRMGKSKSFQEEKAKSKRMDKVKMLFRKKKDGRSSESDDDPLTSRYIEYRGSDVELSDRSTDSSPRRTIMKTEVQHLESGRNSSSSSGRKRVSTPSCDSMGTMTRIKNEKNKESHWLKSLDKMGKKGKQRNKMDDASSELTNSSKPTNLRFFGDTDQESTTNDGDLSDLKIKYGLRRPGRISDSDEDALIVPARSESRMTDSTLKGGSSSGRRHSKSKYDLDRPDYGLKQMNHTLHHSTSNKNDYSGSNLSDSSTLKNDGYDFNGLKYGPAVTRSVSSVTNSTKYATKEKLRNLKSTPTITLTTPEESLSRRVKSHGNLYTQGGRRRLYDSSAESATEGDSSQHSSKSMIYLHAATVGDIPGPRNIYKSDRRSQSREELSSIGDSTILVPGKKTLSRSFSVLAPWRPKHNKEDRTLHYDSGLDHGKGKPPTGVPRTKRSSSKERKPNELRFNTIGKENRRRKALLR